MTQARDEREARKNLCNAGSLHLETLDRPVALDIVKKVCFYIAHYPVRWTAQSTLHFTPWQTCSFLHQLRFSGKHSSQAAIAHEDYSLIFQPLSIARYSFIKLRELGCHGDNDTSLLRNGIRTLALVIASLAFYRAPQYMERTMLIKHIKSLVRN